LEDSGKKNGEWGGREKKEGWSRRLETRVVRGRARQTEARKGKDECQARGPKKSKIDRRRARVQEFSWLNPGYKGGDHHFECVSGGPAQK